MNNDMVNSNIVSVYKNEKMEYPELPPFNPSVRYPEYPFEDISKDPNLVYEGVRKSLFQLGLDKKHFNKKEWNPFGILINPGDNVLIKPNMVMHINRGKGSINSLITHGSIIRAITDYVVIALQGKGKITIADAPLQKCNFHILSKINSLEDIKNHYLKYTNIGIYIFDLRQEIAITNDNWEIIKIEKNINYKLEYSAIDLGSSSFLNDISDGYKKYRVTDYNARKMKKHHNKDTNEYFIANSVLEADVIINLPKLKTHRKAGITCSLKNIIGINGSKDWLPHHRKGSKSKLSDEYVTKSIVRTFIVTVKEIIDILNTSNLHIFAYPLYLIKKIMGRIEKITSNNEYSEGSWWGNDTIWRTTLDLNRIIKYVSNEGELTDKIQRKYITIVDAIISGEGEGPLEPSDKKMGIILSGFNPFFTDYVAAKLMGFDPKIIPTIYNGFNGSNSIFSYDRNNIEIRSNSVFYNNIHVDKLKCKSSFISARGWSGHIENQKLKHFR